MTIPRYLLSFLVAATLAAAQPKNPEAALGAARHLEEAEGNYPAAIEAYKKLVTQAGKNRALAAKALVRMGQCYEKLGDAEARKTYERVVREFGDQKESETAARARLAAMGKSAAGPNPRLIGKDSWVAGPSPDGRFLLQSGANWDLDLRDLQTGQIRHIAKSPWADAVFSPDGRQVAFLRYTKDPFELRIVGADGSAERRLWQGDKGWGAWGVQWFPDGKRIMVAVWPGKSQARLVAISATDGAVTTLWEGKPENRSDSRLSPDGKSVVYVRRIRENPIADELWLLRLEDRSESLLFEAQSTVDFPKWTPDGTGVVFLSDRRAPGASVDLWLLRTSGGKPLGFPELIKTGFGEMANGRLTIIPSGPITRDGTYYFHRGTGGGMAQILTTKFDPVSGKVMGAPSYVARSGGTSRSLSLSRDGRFLSYISEWQRLVIQSVETGEERVVPLDADRSQVNWALMFPDGQSFLVVAIHPKDGRGLYRVDAASGAWISLSRQGEPRVQGWPNGISPDGKTIYFGQDGRLIARNLETRQERVLKEWSGLFSLSHDGRQIALAPCDGNDCVIEVLPAAGGPARQVHRVRGTREVETAWEPDGRHLIFIPRDGSGNTRGVMRVSVEGGEAQPIGLSDPEDAEIQFPRVLRHPVVHPNGRQFFYTPMGDKFGSQGGTWALENFLPGLKASRQ